METELRRQAIGALLRGERVAVFLESWEDAKEEVRAIADELPADPAFRVSLTNGRLAITVEGERGGRGIRFYSLASEGYRGWSCDRLFLPAGVSAEVEASVLPMVAASPVGVVVRV